MREVSFFALAEVGRDRGVSRVSSDGSACAAIVLTIDMCSTTIADLVVALGTGQIKTGAP